MKRKEKVTLSYFYKRNEKIEFNYEYLACIYILIYIYIFIYLFMYVCAMSFIWIQEFV